MRWLIKIDKAAQGPFEEQHTLRLLREYPTAQVRGEGGGEWMPAAQSPFASYLVESTTVAAAVPTPRGPAAPAKPSVKYKVIVVLASIFLLIGIASTYGWLGIGLGVALGAWTIHRHRRDLPSVLGVAFGRGRGIVLTALTVIIAAILVLQGIGALLAAHAKEQVAEQERKAEEQKQAAVEAKRADLQQQLPAEIDAWRQKLGEAARVGESASQLDNAKTLTAKLAAELEAAATTLGKPTAELEALQADTGHQLDQINARIELPTKLARVEQAIATGKKLSRGNTFMEADASFDSALQLLNEIEGGGDALKPFYPKAFNPTTRRADVTKLKTNIAAPLAQERKRHEREEKKRQEKEARQAAYAALCGEKPVVSAWDGEVIGLESAIKENAHDPDSIDVEDCTDPQLSSDECWVFACKVRGKNAFGAMILQHKAFSFSKALGFRER